MVFKGHWGRSSSEAEQLQPQSRGWPQHGGGRVWRSQDGMCTLGCGHLLMWYRLLTSPFGSCLTVVAEFTCTADLRAYWPPFVGSFLQSGLCSSPSFLRSALLTDRLLEKLVWRILFPVEISLQPFHPWGRCPVNGCTWGLLTEEDRTRQREWCPIHCWIWASPFFLIFSIKCAGLLGSLVLRVLLVFSCGVVLHICILQSCYRPLRYMPYVVFKLLHGFDFPLFPVTTLQLFAEPRNVSVIALSVFVFPLHNGEECDCLCLIPLRNKPASGHRSLLALPYRVFLSEQSLFPSLWGCPVPLWQRVVYSPLDHCRFFVCLFNWNCICNSPGGTRVMFYGNVHVHY